MRRLRSVGMCAVAVAVLGAVGAGSASAALPEIGRCVAEAGGGYSDSSCTKKATKGTGSFEFVKNAVKKKFSAEGGEVKLAGATGTEFRCTSEHMTGEYLEKGTTPQTKEVQHVLKTYSGCEMSLFGAECKSEGAGAGEIRWKALKGKLAYTSGKKTPAVKLNLSLSPEVPKKGFVEFECPAVGIAILVAEGAEKGHETILANIGPLNSMSSTATLEYSGSSGHQEPDSVEGLPTVIDNLEYSLMGPKGTFERIAEVDTLTITNEEELEIKP
jgi:hypothetical protein